MNDVCGNTFAVCCEDRTKHINTHCGQNAEFMTLKYVLRKVTTVLTSRGLPSLGPRSPGAAKFSAMAPDVFSITIAGSLIHAICLTPYF